MAVTSQRTHCSRVCGEADVNRPVLPGISQCSVHLATTTDNGVTGFRIRRIYFCVVLERTLYLLTKFAIRQQACYPGSLTRLAFPEALDGIIFILLHENTGLINLTLFCSVTCRAQPRSNRLHRAAEVGGGCTTSACGECTV